MATNSDQTRQPEPIDRRRLFLSVGLSLVFIMLSLFLPAGTWMWKRGWLFMLLIIVVSIPATFYLRRVNPEIFAARINRQKGTKRWDLLLGTIFILPTMVAIRSWQPWTMGGITGPRALVGLRAGLCPSDNRNGGSDMGRVS